ncbi:MAG: flavin reductase family protein [Rhodospirillales bacterium]|nr:flavin reductase family protein [Rhodospirillales bacterium]
MSVNPNTFREALARFASGVCVVTTVGKDGRPAGVTISAFSSLSLHPPLVLFCIGKQSANIAAWLAGRHFTVNVLSETQAHLSDAFASRREDKFVGVEGTIGANGCFRLKGCLASLECTRSSLHDEGDHHIVVGRVEHVHLEHNMRPLLRFRGAYERIDSAALPPVIAES